MAALIEKLEPASRVPSGDLKRRLVEHYDLIKRPNDLVRVTQVSSHHFRVNTLSLITWCRRTTSSRASFCMWKTRMASW